MEEKNLRILYHRSLVLVIADAEKHINDMETSLAQPGDVQVGLINMLANALELLKEKLEGYNEELTRTNSISISSMKIFLSNVKEKYGKEPQFSFLKDIEI